jgi:hypothetical protein
VVNSTLRPHFTPWKDPVPIVQEAWWAPGPVWTGAENLTPTSIRSPDRPARSQSLYRLSYSALILMVCSGILRDNRSFRTFCLLAKHFCTIGNNMSSPGNLHFIWFYRNTALFKTGISDFNGDSIKHVHSPENCFLCVKNLKHVVIWELRI